MPKSLDVTAVTKHVQIEPARYEEGELHAGLSKEIAEGTHLVLGIRRAMPERQGEALSGVLNQARAITADGKVDLNEIFSAVLKSDVSGLVS